MGSARLAGSATMSEPFYRRIITDLRARIANGEFAPGDKLPSTRDLVAYYREHLPAENLNPATVRHAISLLIELGELRGQQGLGVYVVGRRAAH